MKITLSPCKNSSIDIRSDRELSDLEYAEDIVLLSKDASKMPIFLDRLNDSAGIFDMQNVVAREELDGIGRFSYMGS